MSFWISYFYKYFKVFFLINLKNTEKKIKIKTYNI